MKRKKYVAPKITEILSLYGERIMEGGSVHGPGNYQKGLHNDGESTEDDEAYAKQFALDDWTPWEDTGF